MKMDENDLKRIAAATEYYECCEEEGEVTKDSMEDCIDTYLSLIENNRDTFERVYRCMVNDHEHKYFKAEDIEAVKKKFDC